MIQPNLLRKLLMSIDFQLMCFHYFQQVRKIRRNTNRSLNLRKSSLIAEIKKSVECDISRKLRASWLPHCYILQGARRKQKKLTTLK